MLFITSRFFITVSLCMIPVNKFKWLDMKVEIINTKEHLGDQC